MIGRIAITLCVLVGVATACPPSDEELERVATLQAEIQREKLPAAAATSPSDDAAGVAFALGLMGASTLFFAITRRNAVRRTFVTSRRRRESSLGLAQSLARIQRVPVILLGLACLGVLSQVSLQWTVAPAILFVICVVTMWRLQHVLGLDAATVSSHGHFLFIEQGGKLVGWIAAPPRQVVRAAVPVARTV
jgi:hypothetical protein